MNPIIASQFYRELVKARLAKKAASQGEANSERKVRKRKIDEPALKSRRHHSLPERIAQARDRILAEELGVPLFNNDMERRLEPMLDRFRELYAPPPFGRFSTAYDRLLRRTNAPELAIRSVIIPETKSAEGILVQSTTVLWTSIVERMGRNWSEAHTIGSELWEELIAGAFKLAGFDEVTLTPRSGDFGRDVIAVTKGIGCIKVIGSVKAYKPSLLVPHDDVRALLGVLTGEQNASKGIITTTSDFAPRISSDPFIKPFLPTRLELINGKELREWLLRLARTK
jgi:restriction system protein